MCEVSITKRLQPTWRRVVGGGPLKHHPKQLCSHETAIGYHLSLLGSRQS
jgi:hypothetical protein